MTVLTIHITATNGTGILNLTKGRRHSICKTAAGSEAMVRC